MAATNISSKIALKRVRSISFDVTGTLVIHKLPVYQTYAEAAIWAKLDNPPTAEELKPAFKLAYKQTLLEYPCFKGNSGGERDWWAHCVKLTLQHAGRTYSKSDFNRYFRRVYSQYGCNEGYETLPDVKAFLNFLQSQNEKYLLGICSNTPSRTMETALPILGLHNYFNFFVCCQDVGHEKPSPEIFQETYEQAKFWLPDLKKEEVLHIGDSMAADFCGARRFGFQSLLLDRSQNPRVTVYQDWLETPDYPGKTDRDIQQGTVTDLLQIIPLLKNSKLN